MNNKTVLVQCKCNSYRWLTTGGGFIVCAKCGVKLQRDDRLDRTWIDFEYKHYAIVQKHSVFSALDELVSA